MNKMLNELKSNKSLLDKPDIFWGEMAPCEHLLQLYDDSVNFLDTLESFVACGILAGDGVIVIATAQHREALHIRLEKRGINLATVQAQNKYIPFDAEETLAKFMVQGWPDEQLFEKLVHELLLRAKGGHLPNTRRVRAFGEMVAVLWARGDYAATVRLEHLWHKLCQAEKFSLLCAYPRSGFTDHANTSLQKICDAHTRFFMT